MTLPITMTAFLSGVACRNTFNYVESQSNFMCGIPNMSTIQLKTGGGASWECMSYILIAYIN